MFVRSLLLTLSLVALGGCKVQSDLGVTCNITARAPDGGIRLVKESEIKEGAFKDFISFGSTDCEDLTCVRDSNAPRPRVGGDAGMIDFAANATGYCSKVCEPTNQNACPPSDPSDSTNAARKLNCRALLLDQDTLSQICQGDGGSKPEICMTSTAFFCARGAGANDAGT